MDIEQLRQTAAECAAAGDRDGEIQAYRRAAELGDTDSAIFLGNALRANGETDAAREAYQSAEHRGHSEAAMSLGLLLSDLGDKEGARAAFLRSIERGSALASLNLGAMLADEGEFDDARLHLQRAADAGDSSAFWALGRISQDLRDWTEAVEQYRKGSELGHADCAFGLGVSLYEVGDPSGAQAAFEAAIVLGHEGAQDVLDALLREAEDPVLHAARVGELWNDLHALYKAVAYHRQELGRSWIESKAAVEEAKRRQEVLTSAHHDVRQQLNALANRFGVTPRELASQAVVGSVSVPGPGAWLSAKVGTPGQWETAPSQSQAISRDLTEAQEALTQAQKKMLGAGIRRKGIQALGRTQARLSGLADAMKSAKEGVEKAEKAQRESANDQAASARQSLELLTRAASASRDQLPPALQPWTSPAWETWSADDRSSRGLRFAYGGTLVPKRDDRLGPNADFASDVRTPWGYSLYDSWWIRHQGQSHTVHEFTRSMMLRHLVTVGPGEVRFCIYDPVGLGQSAGELLDLAEYDAELIGGKVWTSSSDLEAQLTDLSSHLELVIQKYLRTTYESINDFNDAAGEIAEPYRVLVLFDFPTGLTAESAGKLRSILENGPRCGVYTIVCYDSTIPAPYGVDVDQLQACARPLLLDADFVEDIDGYEFRTCLEPDLLPPGSPVARRLIDGIGRAAISRTEAAVTFDKVFTLFANAAARGLQPELSDAPTRTDITDPNSWWSDDSTRGLFSPIGQKGARDVAVLGFDSSDRAGALLVGRPGSGKSTLLHAYLGGLTTLYGPDELELYLIDFKEGVEFKAYAEERLPHAKVVAIESDREFGLSVLESIQGEITQRAELLRSTGGRQAGMQALREARGDKIPRVLLVFDEFQVLFSRNDRVGLAAADLLESIIRQGRGFGIHVLLGSQSLAGLDALGAHVPQLLPVRIVLPAAEADARKVLGDNNNAGDYLTSHGEGVLNSSGGAVEANERFKGALLSEEDRVARLVALRRKADDAGFTRAPRVFEGNALLPLSGHDSKRFREELASSGQRPVRVRCGEPMTVGDVGDLTLSREAGSNVLAIVRGGDADADPGASATGPAYGLLASAITSVAMSDASVDVVDFMPVDDGLDDLLAPLLDAQRITLKRRRAFADVVTSYVAELEERLDLDDTTKPPMVLFLFGVHRARDLDSEFGSLDADTELVDKLEQLMRDGPEVGIHVWLWSDSVAGASRRLTPRMMRETAWRVAGRMSSDDSHVFLSAGDARDLRESQLWLANDDRGVATRLSAYSPPTAEWVAEVTAATLSE